MGSNSLTQHSNGAAAELFVAAYFAGIGMGVSIPFTTQSRYDLVLDDGEFLAKVQVKKATRTKTGNHSYLQARISGKNKLTNTPYKEGDFDYFAFTDMKDIWFVPYEELAGLTSVCLGSSNPEYKPQTKYDMTKWRVQ